MIGNSAVGPVYRAYQASSITKGYEFSFFASAGDMYERLSFQGSTIVNARFSSGGSADISDYDYFAIYGSMPAPHQCFDHEQKLSAAPSSDQVRSVALRNWILQFRSARLLLELQTITHKPIFVVSGNIKLHEVGVASPADYARGAALIAAAIAPGVYVPFPQQFFSCDGRPDYKYYRDSLNVNGVEPDRKLMPAHHFNHLNQAGGALVLAEIMQRLRQI